MGQGYAHPAFSVDHPISAAKTEEDKTKKISVYVCVFKIASMRKPGDSFPEVIYVHVPEGAKTQNMPVVLGGASPSEVARFQKGDLYFTYRDEKLLKGDPITHYSAIRRFGTPIAWISTEKGVVHICYEDFEDCGLSYTISNPSNVKLGKLLIIPSFTAEKK